MPCSACHPFDAVPPTFYAPPVSASDSQRAYRHVRRAVGACVAPGWLTALSGGLPGITVSTRLATLAPELRPPTTRMRTFRSI